jgi:hypothetical protein
MPATAQTAIAVIGIDIGKNSFHVVGQDTRGQIVLRQKWSRHQVEARFANMPPCLIGMEACVGLRTKLVCQPNTMAQWHRLAQFHPSTKEKPLANQAHALSAVPNWAIA